MVVLDKALFNQFTKFSVVGVLGFVANVAVVYAVRGALGLYWAGAAAFVIAASLTWICNRIWTFRSPARAAASRQWSMYLGTSLIGFAFYFGVYSLTVAAVPLSQIVPLIPVGAGSIAGLFSNFILARHVVFS